MDLGIVGLAEITEIGRGPHARVYRARQPELGRVVAVKVFDSSWGPVGQRAAAREEVQRQFLREQQTLGRLSDHSGIVPMLSSGETAQGAPYVLMPFYEQGSLARRLDPTNRMPWQEAVGLMETVASTTEEIHRLGITHGNLKPSNVLLSDLLQPNVSDLSIEALSPINPNSPYVAPELRMSNRATARSDVFSLGAVLFALLTGRTPAISPGIAPSSELPEDVPVRIGDFVDRSMAEDAEQRPNDAAGFLLGLRGTRPPSDDTAALAATAATPIVAASTVATETVSPAGPEADIIDPLAETSPTPVVRPKDLGPLVLVTLSLLAVIGFGTGAYLAFGRTNSQLAEAGSAISTPTSLDATSVSVQGSTQITVPQEVTTTQPATTELPTTTEIPTTTEAPTTTETTTESSTSAADPRAPQILTLAVVDITEETARVIFTASECTGTRYQISGLTSGDSGYPNAKECWNAHQLLLGREPFTSSKLQADTEYTVTVVLVNKDGVESPERSVTFRTEEATEVVTPPIISELTVSQVTATSARVSFRTDKCTGSQYVVNGAPHHNVGYPFGSECFNNHWAELGSAPYSPGPLTPGTTYQVVVTAILDDGTESVPRQVAFTTAALATTSEATTSQVPAETLPPETQATETQPTETLPAETVPG